MTEAETLRLILQNKFDRIENLVQMNHAATLAIPSVLGAIWGISLKKCGFDSILIVSIISIGLLLVWRFFAHYLDNDIAKNYSKIMHLEKDLEISREHSIFSGLIPTVIAYQKTISDQLFRNANVLCHDQRIELIDQLDKKHLLGYRGHDAWDIFAFFLISLNIIILLSYYSLITFAEVSNFTIVLLVTLPLFCIFHIREFFYLFVEVQRDPIEPELCKLIENAKKILPKNDNC